MNLLDNKKKIFLTIIIFAIIILSILVIYLLFKNKTPSDTYIPQEIDGVLILNILVVCSSPRSTNYPREIDKITKFLESYYNKKIILNETFIEPGIPVEDVNFIDGYFPRDVNVDYKFDVIWFSGCNLLNYWIFSGNVNNKLLKFRQLLDDDGIFFFTENPSYERIDEDIKPFASIEDIEIHETSFPAYQSQETFNFYDKFKKLIQSSKKYPYIYQFIPGIEIEIEEEKKEGKEIVEEGDVKQENLIVCTDETLPNELPRFFQKIEVAGDGWCFYRSVIAANNLNLGIPIDFDKLKKSIVKNDPELPELKNFLQKIKFEIIKDISLGKEYTEFLKAVYKNFENIVYNLDTLTGGFSLPIEYWGDPNISGNVISDELNTNILVYRLNDDGTCVLSKGREFPEKRTKRNTIYLLHQGKGAAEHYSILVPV